MGVTLSEMAQKVNRHCAPQSLRKSPLSTPKLRPLPIYFYTLKDPLLFCRTARHGRPSGVCDEFLWRAFGLRQNIAYALVEKE
jgi:hypothetical protein